MHYIIIGGGLAGLAAARTLAQKGQSYQLFEKGAQLGGRVQTSQIEGHLIDHGFQVFLPSYEEASQVFDYPALQFHSFDPGALVLYADGQKDLIGDPLRQARRVFSSLFSKVGSLADKLRLLKLRSAVAGFPERRKLEIKKQSTYDFLVDFGFGQEMIQNFFTPFFSGVFFDPKLETSSEIFLYLYKHFSSSLASLPAQGMGSLITQLAEGLDQDKLHLQEEVVAISEGKVELASGKTVKGDRILLAAPTNDIRTATALPRRDAFRSAHTLYFESEEAPHPHKMVGIVAKAKSRINNLTVMSNINPNYAPRDKHQIAISTFDQNLNKEGMLAIRAECVAWFGSKANDWKLIDKHHIIKALPNQKEVKFQYDVSSNRLSEQLYLAGDYTMYGSINAALVSGRQAAMLAMS